MFINNRGQKVTVIVEGGEPVREGELAVNARYLAECLGSHIKDGYGEMGQAIPFATDDDSEPEPAKPRRKVSRRELDKLAVATHHEKE